MEKLTPNAHTNVYGGPPMIEPSAEALRRAIEIYDIAIHHRIKDISGDLVAVGQDIIERIAIALTEARADAIEAAAKTVLDMPVQIYRDGPTAWERSCKAATFDDAVEAIRDIAGAHKYVTHAHK